MNFFPILIFAALVTLTGCKPKETGLSGQVFIVTRGGENIKLGLVEAHLIEKHQMSQFLETNLQSFIEPEFLSRSHELESAKTALLKANIALNSFPKVPDGEDSIRSQMDARLEKDIEDLEKEKKWSINDDYLVAAAQDYLTNMEDILKDYNPGRNKIRGDCWRAEFRVAKAKIILGEFPTVETYFTNFSSTMGQKTVTDADGKFSFSYPCDKRFSLFAKAERLVGDQTEHYCWLVDAPSNIENAQIFLSNNNFVFIDPDGYFKIKPVPDYQEPTVAP